MSQIKVFARQTGKRFESANLKLLELAFTYSWLEEAISVSWVGSTITERLIHMDRFRYTYLSVRKLFFAKQFYRLGK